MDGNVTPPTREENVLSLAGVVLAAMSRSPQGLRLGLLALALVLVIAATAWGQIRLNAWNQPFYDALAQKDLTGVILQLKVYVAIAAGLLILNVSQTWLSQTMKLRLREALTRDLFHQWLAPKRAVLLAQAGEIGVNPDQRIHADAQHLADLSTDLGVGLAQASLLLASFIGVLWVLSTGVVFDLAGVHVDVPGYMVWCALIYALIGSLASWWVGRPLMALGAERYGRESDVRFALVDVSEHSEPIALMGAEAREEQRLSGAFDALVAILRKLVGATTNLTWVTAGYGWFAIVAPVLVAAPAYLYGQLSFGGLLMAAGAFTQAQQSLRWFVDNAGVIADWRATLARVGLFRRALLEQAALERELNAPGAAHAHIARLVEERNSFLLQDVALALPSRQTRLNESPIEIGPGARVHIVGEHGCGKTLLFRALAGLWRSGRGRILMPSETRIAFMPKRAYIPDLSLREILAYPAPASTFRDHEMNAALARFDLGYLSTALDRAGGWDRELADPERQAIAFARLLLRRPDFVVIDEAIDALAPETKALVADMFNRELKSSALIYISGPRDADPLFARSYRLETVQTAQT
jgi:putative ATP-binding cassette transporter